MTAFIALRGISKRFGDTVAVREVELDLADGETFSLLGPSGCGKTTLLRILAGFVEPDAGSVWVDGVDLTRIPPNRRPINTVFQNYALFPHMTVRENIAFGRKVAKLPPAQIRREVDHMLDLVQLEQHADKRPHQISGGEKQRVAIARALINQPRLLLLDEPLAALDLKLRQHMLLELERIHRDVGTTFLYVTHDQSEAMGLSDRLAVMNQGRIEQIGTPAEVYETPASRFVADFIGDTNILDGTLSSQPDGDSRQLTLPQLGTVSVRTASSLRPGERVHLCLRPEKLHLENGQSTLPADWNRLPGRILDWNYFGTHTRFLVEVGSQQLHVVQAHQHRAPHQSGYQTGDSVWLRWHPEDGYLMPNEAAPPQ